MWRDAILIILRYTRNQRRGEKDVEFDLTRIRKLRSAMLVKPSVCVERARLMTESYRRTEGEPAPVRRAKAFAHICGT
jgi:hypothetical protein